MNFSIKKLKLSFWIVTVLSSAYAIMIFHALMPLFNYSGIMGNVYLPFENQTSRMMTIALAGLLIIPLVCITDDLLHKLSFVGIITVLTLVQIPFVDSDLVRLNAMKKRYNDLIEKEPSYANTENSKKLLVAIKTNNPDVFIQILANSDENKKIDDKSANYLLSIVLDVLPEYRKELKDMLADNYLTISEYNSIKKELLANIIKKDLNSDQIAMIGGLK